MKRFLIACQSFTVANDVCAAFTSENSTPIFVFSSETPKKSIKTHGETETVKDKRNPRFVCL